MPTGDTVDSEAVRRYADSLSMDLSTAELEAFAEQFAQQDAALADVDVLASPTVSMLPPKWDADMDDVFGSLANTGPFNVTGHPAVSVPCGTVDGLPVGLQFVAERGDDAAALRAAPSWMALRD